MKKLLLLLFTIVAANQLSIAQLGINFDKTYANNGTAKLSNVDFDYYFENLYLYKNNEDVLAYGSYYDYDTEEGGFLFTKYGKNGDLDVNFADKGILKIPYTAYDEKFYSIIRVKEASDQSFIVLLADDIVSNADTSGVICFTSIGKIVTDFGNGGVLSSENAFIGDIDMLADNKILLLTVKADSTGLYNGFERYTQIGILDKSYGTNGYALFDKGFNIFTQMEKSGQDYFISGVSIDITNFAFNPALAKVSSEGQLKKDFANNGLASNISSPTDEDIQPIKLKLLSDGSFLTYGISINLLNDSTSYYISKIKKDGTLDDTFGKDGYLFFPESGSGLFDLSVLEVPNNKLLVSNVLFNDDDTVESVFQLYNSKGVTEKQFGKNGDLHVKLENKDLSIILSTTLLPNGKILISGGYYDENDEISIATINRITLEYGVNTKEENEAFANISIYPNPIIESTTLSYNLIENETISATLYDLQGKAVQQVLSPQFRNAGKQNETLQFNTALPSGQYLLKIDIAEKGTKTLKVNKL